MIKSDKNYHVSFKALREYFSMSQSDISKYFGIPLGTIKNWDQGVSDPPRYVLDMIFTILWHEVFSKDIGDNLK